MGVSLWGQASVDDPNNPKSNTLIVFTAPGTFLSLHTRQHTIDGRLIPNVHQVEIVQCVGSGDDIQCSQPMMTHHPADKGRWDSLGQYLCRDIEDEALAADCKCAFFRVNLPFWAPFICDE